MSAPTAAPLPIDVQSTAPVPMSRLAAVEFRKALDTRAGRWFAVSILGLCLAVLTIYAFAAPDTDKDYGDFLLGNITINSLAEIHTACLGSALWRDIRAGTRACEAGCEYYSVCGGGSPVNSSYKITPSE